jgi:hypothetical protein
MLKTLFAIVGVVAALSAVRALAANGPPNTLTADEKKAGWRLLFDGKTTAGWRGYQKKEMPAGWKVVGGALTLADKGAGDIVTVEEFKNFELAIDWRIAKGGNSGIMYRVGESENAPYLTGPEYQVLDDERHPDANQGAPGTRKAGALYDMYPVEKKVAHPAGQWNSARIVVVGKTIEHWLNGEKVVETRIGTPGWNERLAKSKWAKVANFAKLASGYIDLQDHGDKVEFRNIKVREIGTRRADGAPPAP